MAAVDEVGALLRSLRGVWDEDSVDELDHALQATARAIDDGADDELVLAAALHDLAHSPLFVLRNGRAMLAHTFAGTSLKSVLGLESESTVFARYREQRRRERELVSCSSAIGELRTIAASARPVSAVEEARL